MEIATRLGLIRALSVFACGLLFAACQEAGHQKVATAPEMSESASPTDTLNPDEYSGVRVDLAAITAGSSSCSNEYLQASGPQFVSCNPYTCGYSDTLQLYQSCDNSLGGWVYPSIVGGGGSSSLPTVTASWWHHLYINKIPAVDSLSLHAVVNSQNTGCQFDAFIVGVGSGRQTHYTNPFVYVPSSDSVARQYIEADFSCPNPGGGGHLGPVSAGGQ